MTEFSKDQLDKIRDKLDRSGVKPKCLACQRGTMVLNRGQIGISEVGQLRGNEAATTGGTSGAPGRIATCVLFTCNTCGYVRLHSLAALDIADRRRWDRALLAIYLQALSARGVAAPAFDSAWDALRREVVWGLFIFLINEPMFQTEAANTAYAARFAAAAQDWRVR